MAISFVNKGTFDSGNGAISPGVPTGYTTDDLFLLFVESANEAISMTTGGWTEVGVQANQATGTAATAGGVRLAVFYKWSTASETAPIVADSGNHTAGIMLAFRGVDKSTPFPQLLSKIDSVATASLVCPTVTTTTDGCWIVNGIALDYDGASTTHLSAWVNAGLTSFTADHQQTVSTGVGGGVAISHGIKTTAGAVTATTATGAASTTHGYLTLALKPAIENYNAVITSTNGDVESFTASKQITIASVTSTNGDVISITGNMGYNTTLSDSLGDQFTESGIKNISIIIIDSIGDIEILTSTKSGLITIVSTNGDQFSYTGSKQNSIILSDSIGDQLLKTVFKGINVSLSDSIGDQYTESAIAGISTYDYSGTVSSTNGDQFSYTSQKGSDGITSSTNGDQYTGTGIKSSLLIVLDTIGDQYTKSGSKGSTIIILDSIGDQYTESGNSALPTYDYYGSILSSIGDSNILAGSKLARSPPLEFIIGDTETIIGSKSNSGTISDSIGYLYIISGNASKRFSLSLKITKTVTLSDNIQKEIVKDDLFMDIVIHDNIYANMVITQNKITDEVVSNRVIRFEKELQ